MGVRRIELGYVVYTATAGDVRPLDDRIAAIVERLYTGGLYCHTCRRDGAVPCDHVDEVVRYVHQRDWLMGD